MWDDELKGLGCKVTPAGRKVYVVQYRLNGRAGKTQRVTPGVHGKIAPDQARGQAKAALGKIAGGVDPAHEKREQKAQAGSPLDAHGPCPMVQTWSRSADKRFMTSWRPLLRSVIGQGPNDRRARVRL
jgi:hypothetical protein